MRGVLKSTTMDNGALCVMTFGTSMMPTWCADNLVTVEPHLLLQKLPLVKALVQSTMTMCSALGVRYAWLTAPIMVLGLGTVFTLKMQEWCAILLHKVSLKLVSESTIELSM